MRRGRKPQREDVLDPVVDRRTGEWRATLRLCHRPGDELPVAIADGGLVLAHVRAIHRKVGDDLAQRAGKAGQREVAARAVLLGDGVQPVREHVQLRGH
jgi:hypothetical protein